MCAVSLLETTLVARKGFCDSLRALVNLEKEMGLQALQRISITGLQAQMIHNPDLLQMYQLTNLTELCALIH